MSQDSLPATYEQTMTLAAIHAAGREIAASLDLDRALQLVMEKAAVPMPLMQPRCSWPRSLRTKRPFFPLRYLQN